MVFILLTAITIILCNYNNVYTEESYKSIGGEQDNLKLETKTEINNMDYSKSQQRNKLIEGNIQNNTSNDANNSVSSNTKVKRFEYKSLMFSSKNIDDILKLLPRIGKGVSIIDNFSFGDSGEQQLIDENNISIYLNSIMYISKNNWAIWLNGNKITNLNNGDGEVIITAISPLRATFIWAIDIARWDIINMNKNIPESRYKITDKGVNIYFSLSPNQTFIPSLNKIIEGKMKIEEPKDNNINQNNNNNLNNNNDNLNNNNNDDKNNLNPNDFNKNDSLFF